MKMRIVTDSYFKERGWKQKLLFAGCLIIGLSSCADLPQETPIEIAGGEIPAASTSADVAAYPSPTSIPATPTPTFHPPTLTPGLVPPTATSLPSPTPTLPPTPWPTPEAFFDGVKITFINNSGFMITVGDKKILIDALYDTYPDRTAPKREVLQRAVNAQPPFDQVDLVMATHDHADHFSAELVRDHLRRNPGAVFVSSRDAVRQLSDLGEDDQDRLIPVDLGPGESTHLSVNGIEIDCLYITHGDDSILNIGFVITVGETTFFHTGDMNIDSQTGDFVSLADLQAYGLPQKEIDFAFLPSHIFSLAEYSPLLLEGIQAKYNAPMHYLYQYPPTGIEDNFSNAVVFKDTMESWVMPVEVSFPSPSGAPPNLDGRFEEGEWAGAFQTQLSDGSDLYLFQDSEFVYGGIAAANASSGVGSLCIERDNQVKILHSSAALGTAIYEKSEPNWLLIQDFTWRCRGTTDGERDREERNRFLESDGWLANNGRMGEPGILEFIIALPENSLRLAVVYLKTSDLDSKIWWPVSLNDGCRTEMLLGKSISNQADFSPETWVYVVAK